MNLTFDTVAAIGAIIGAVSTFAVCKWRISDLARRVEILETRERESVNRVTRLDTQLESALKLLTQIARKLNVVEE